MTLRDRFTLRAIAGMLAAGLLALGPAAVLGQGMAAPGVGPKAPIVVGLPVPQWNSSGELVVRPNVTAAGYAPPPGAPAYALPSAGAYPSPGAGQWPVQPAAAEYMAEPLPQPFGPPQGASAALGSAAPAGATDSSSGGALGPIGLISKIFRSDPTDLFWEAKGEPIVPYDFEGFSFPEFPEHCVSPTGEAGLGRELVMLAPFEIDVTQPFGNFLFRLDAAYGIMRPDRAEYFWAAPPRGPLLPETNVDYQDLRFRWEAGGDAFSLATEVPVRFLNPEFNGNTGGVGDIQLVQKTRMMNGHRWQITQFLRTAFGSGNPRKGLGTGHFVLEPGVLCRYMVDDLTYLHGQIKMAIPLGANPMWSGPVVNLGVGISHVFYETDTVAYIPTLELIDLIVIDGLTTPPGGGPPTDVTGDSILYIAPGLRVAMDTGGDLGIVELGFASLLGISSNGHYDALLRLDLRFVF